MRRFHRWLGAGSAAIVLLAVVTGLLWAYAPYLYWESGYLERKHSPVVDGYDELALTHHGAIRLVREQLGTDAVISTVTLRSELGVAFYEVAGKRTGKEFTVLIDARAGKIVSPLNPELAAQIAGQYVKGEPAPVSTALLDQFVHRSGKVHESVYRVRFAAERNPEIFVSASSGKIIEEQDDVRRFHFWVMRLHQLNFFGFKKTLTIVPGTALLLLLVSGLVLSRRSRLRSGNSILFSSR